MHTYSYAHQLFVLMHAEHANSMNGWPLDTSVALISSPKLSVLSLSMTHCLTKVHLYQVRSRSHKYLF